MSKTPDECDDTTGPAEDRWIGEADVLEAALPADVQAALGRVVGRDSVETIGAWATEVRQHVGGAVAIDDLCVTDEETDHWGIVDGERYRFACFYDAVILAGLVEGPVDIHTTSPAGAVIEARAVGTAVLEVDPPDAVFSFGVDPTVDPPSDDTTIFERGYAAICPYVRAFPNRQAYHDWRATVPAATVAMPLDGATALAAALVE